MNRLRIMACPRSGTKYTALLMQKAGLEVGHEKLLEDGISTWLIDTKQLEGVDLAQMVYVHQVRDPLATISSLMTLQWWNKGGMPYLREYVNLSDGPPLKRSMQMYLNWNTLIEQMCLFTYPVERMDEYWEDILSRMGVKQRSMPQLDITTNHRKHDKLTWKELSATSELLTMKIKEKSRTWGYR